MADDVPELLMPLQAAHYLGITPELLFAYTRKRFRKNENDSRRLTTCDVASSTRFARTALDEFEAYLKEPWAPIGADRVDPPKCVLDHLRAEGGNQCIRCGSGIGVQTAHIEPWAATRSNFHHNLVRVCSRCHIEHDEHNSLSTEQLLALKQAGIARTRASLAQRMALQQLDATPPPRAPVFLGRTEMLSNLREALRTCRCVLIEGPGGIGKTQLLLHALEGLEAGRRLIWLDVERYGSSDAVRSALAVAVYSQTSTASLSPKLSTDLDALHACVVFDGLERLRGPDLDDIEDIIVGLQGQTANVQYVITTQVDLERIVADEVVQVSTLDAEASRELLVTLLRESAPVSTDESARLCELADGHPLTLRISASLVNHFGSGRSAIQQIEREGAAAFELQRRAKQDRQTSLNMCLSLAYDALTADEARALFLIANSPAGLSSLQLERSEYLAVEGRTAIAGLQRWNLIQAIDAGQSSERLFTISPIAAYVDQRWRAEHLEIVQEVEGRLIRDFALMAVVISQRAEHAGDLPHMVQRFIDELPNVLRVLDVAEAQAGDDELALFARSVCSALMRFFFILRVPNLGTDVMFRGARLALRDRDARLATGLLAQALALATRNDETDAFAIASAMLGIIRIEDADLETRGNIERVRAMIARQAKDLAAMEHHARLAISFFDSVGNDSGAATNPDVENDNNRNYRSDLFAILGDALLGQNRFEEARAAYETSLATLSGAAIAVNDGQLLHQIGNCESYLGRHKDAALHYAEAAFRFHAIGMRGYLSNALAELGYTTLEAPHEPFGIQIPAEMVMEGLADVADELLRCFSSRLFSRDSSAAALRKIFGVVIVASLVVPASARLLPFAYALKEQLIDPIAADSDGELAHSKRIALIYLDRLAAFAASIGQFEAQSQTTKPTESDVEELAKACHHLPSWMALRTRGFEWLAIYLRRRWSFATSRDALLAAADDAERGLPFRLELQQPPDRPSSR